MAKQRGVKILERRKFITADGQTVEAKLSIDTSGGTTQFFAEVPCLGLTWEREDELVVLRRKVAEAVQRATTATWEPGVRYKVRVDEPGMYQPGVMIEAEEVEVAPSASRQQPRYRWGEPGKYHFDAPYSPQPMTVEPDRAHRDSVEGALPGALSQELIALAQAHWEFGRQLVRLLNAQHAAAWEDPLPLKKKLQQAVKRLSKALAD